jgi:lysophospholipase L1-like esterase
MKIVLKIIIIIFLLTACKQEKLKKGTDKSLKVISYDTIGFSPEHYKKRVKAFSKADAINCKYLFLGNSITERGNWVRLLNDTTIINQGISGDLTFGILKRIKLITRQKPKVIFMMIGVNDLAKKVPDTIIENNIMKIITEINKSLPLTKIYVQSILPINNNIKGFPDDFDYSKNILDINSFLRSKDNINYYFVDLYSKFIDSKNQLDNRYTIDGLHLNELGYKHLIEILKSYHDFSLN